MSRKGRTIKCECRRHKLNNGSQIISYGEFTYLRLGRNAKTIKCNNCGQIYYR